MDVVDLVIHRNVSLYLEDLRLASLEDELSKKLSKDGMEALKSLERLWKSKSKSIWEDLPEILYGWLTVSISLDELLKIWEIKKQRAVIQSQLFPQQFFVPQNAALKRLGKGRRRVEQRQSKFAKRERRSIETQNFPTLKRCVD